MTKHKVMNIGPAIKRLRKQKLMSQEELAEHSSLGLRTISAIENNEEDPRFSTLYNLAIGLDIDILDLVVEIKKEL
ncbi:DNA-binding transcriptional regulator, XRE-family HTH domain [Mesobacillus persicus]|uniref:DNA-binding transcriptional regulator, XRE-family HTH domain n=1 Tax=Mesobacillus persicus TaxID=930146 RepID=A0A1H8AV94_9BACI|nr:helix-turn-helix transcriptional regulator [Mesobacillus persicus]SEM74483.1 DNA-binding transcriptional regulator, XRE-family HTH domain [Mesobacillus persicus]